MQGLKLSFFVFSFCGFIATAFAAEPVKYAKYKFKNSKEAQDSYDSFVKDCLPGKEQLCKEMMLSIAGSAKGAYDTGFGVLEKPFQARLLNDCKNVIEKEYEPLKWSRCLQKKSKALLKEIDANYASLTKIPNLKTDKEKDLAWQNFIAKLVKSKSPLLAYLMQACPQDKGLDNYACAEPAINQASITVDFAERSFSSSAAYVGMYAKLNNDCMTSLKLKKTCDEEFGFYKDANGVADLKKYTEMFGSPIAKIPFIPLGNGDSAPDASKPDAQAATAQTGTGAQTESIEIPSGGGSSGKDTKKKPGTSKKKGSSTPKRGSALQAKGDGKRLDVCLWGDNTIGMQDLICDARGTSAQMFEKSMLELGRDVNIYAYLDRLRIEAISRGIASHKLLTGTDVDVEKLPNKCAPFTDELLADQKKPKPKSKIDDDTFLKGLHATAKKALPFKKEGKTLDKALSMMPGVGDCPFAGKINSGTVRFKNEKEMFAFAQHVLEERDGKATQAIPGFPGCLTPLERDKMDKRRDEVENALLYLVSEENPLIGVGHDGTDKLYDGLPFLDEMATASDVSDLRAKLKREGGALEKAAALQTKTIAKFCDNDAQWDWLIHQQELVNSLISQNPKWASYQDCAMMVFKNGAFEAGKDILKGIAMGGCVLATLATAEAPPVAASISLGCAAAFTGVSALEYVRARAKVRYKFDCLQIKINAEKVCNSEEYLEAAAEYEAAITDLVINGVFVAFEGVAFFRAVGKYLSESELRQIAKLMKAGKIEEAQALAKARALKNGAPQDVVENAVKETAEAPVVGETPKASPAESAPEVPNPTAASAPKPVPKDLGQLEANSKLAYVDKTGNPREVTVIKVEGSGDDAIVHYRIGEGKVQKNLATDFYDDLPGFDPASPPTVKPKGEPESAPAQPKPAAPKKPLKQKGHYAEPPKTWAEMKPITTKATTEESAGIVTVKRGEATVGDTKVIYPKVEYQVPAPGLDGQAILKDAGIPVDPKKIISEGTGGSNRFVATSSKYPDSMIKVYQVGPDTPPDWIAKEIQRELGMEDWLTARGIKVAKINRDPELLKRGIIVQEKVPGLDIGGYYRANDELSSGTSALFKKIHPYDEEMARANYDRFGIMRVERDVAGAETPTGIDMGGNGFEEYSNGVIKAGTDDVYLIDW